MYILQSVSSWTIDDVSRWLEETVCLPEYIEHFRVNAIDGKELLTLNDQSLQLSIGIGTEVALPVCSR